MSAKSVSTLLKALLAFAALLAAMPAAAALQFGSLADRCFTDGTAAETLAEVAGQPQRWSCGEESHSIAAERVFVRFDVKAGADQPRFLETRRAAVKGIDVLAVDARGAAHYAHFARAARRPARRGGYLRVPGPARGAPMRQVIVGFDRPTHRMMLEQAQLAPANAHNNSAAYRLLLTLAALCGMLLMPLMFNAAFYRVLRERFVLWHSALAVSLLLTILVSSGLSFYLGKLPVMAMSAMNTLLFGLSVGAAGMFAHSFIEAGKLDPRLRRALPIAGSWAVLVSALHGFFPFALRPVQSALYYWAYIPVLAVYLWMLADALRRGSRAARYQAIGWAPMILVGLIRLISGLLPSTPSADAMMLFYAGCVVEVLATTLGVADRFMTIKDQRDSARTEALVLERLSERDALTGLFNRRVIEDRFERLRAEGFTALAIIDLDHFKQVNDTHGHAVGDKVLQVVADVLHPDEDTLAFRMGGEEFLLLLRGSGALANAERRRRAITSQIASQIQGLDRVVTASMGLLEVPRSAMPNASFAELYDRADQLLYEAKQAGRNRTLNERLKVFVARRVDRRKVAA